MNTFMVSYDLSKPERNYQKIKDLLEGLPRWAHVLESVWYVRTSLTAEQLAQKVCACVDSDDHFVVSPVDIRKTWWFNLDPQVVEWLQEEYAAA